MLRSRMVPEGVCGTAGAQRLIHWHATCWFCALDICTAGREMGYTCKVCKCAEQENKYIPSETGSYRVDYDPEFAARAASPDEQV